MSVVIESVRDGNIQRLRLSSPDGKNRFTRDGAAGLFHAAERAQKDAGALLIEANGALFSEGLDLTASLEEMIDAARHLARLFELIARSETPTVIAVQGPALGIAVGLVAAGHFVVAAQGAQFGLTEVRFGQWPFASWVYLSSAMGERRTRELALSGRLFSSQQAIQYGLIHETALPFEVEDRATAMAQGMSQASRDAVTRGLRFAASRTPVALEDALRLSAELAQTEDGQEGRTAFAERRAPVWPSRVR